MEQPKLNSGAQYEPEEKKLPITNCHTHIFTSDHVPPLLARTFVPWPLHWLFHLNWILGLSKAWYTGKASPYLWPYQRWYRKARKPLYKVKVAAKRNWLWGALKFLLGVVILASIVHEGYDYSGRVKLINTKTETAPFDKAIEWLERAGILVITDSWFWKAVLLIILLTFFPSGRNLLWFVLKKTSGLLRMLPGPETTKMIQRYWNIVRFAQYEDQFKILMRLRGQYPTGTKFVVLPMDMEFMGARKPKVRYGKQMEELAKIKKNHPNEVHPFIFIDPRRKDVDGVPLFDYKVVGDRIVLEPCFIKTYLEKHKFAGFKIYPALGYYPFEKELLPIWKYAAQEQIPIMTHCIRGTIFYRGNKDADWDFHPWFKEYQGNQNDDPLLAADFQRLLHPQIKAIDLQEIFTHPLNYACLLNETWLIELIKKTNDSKLFAAFGYNPSTDRMTGHLRDLKICFGHFGGEDEWLKYHEHDRGNWAQHLTRHAKVGISFDREDGSRRMEDVWKYADWYTIICSLMLQHNNVYADISYILHADAEILPLLRQTLQHDKLKKQVLFGTDFYVVRNHKSDKQMLGDMRGGLSVEEFDQIARENPVNYLKKTE